MKPSDSNWITKDFSRTFIPNLVTIAVEMINPFLCSLRTKTLQLSDIDCEFNRDRELSDVTVRCRSAYSRGRCVIDDTLSLIL